MSSPLRIGVVGAGTNTRDKHLPGFQRLPGVVVEAVANRSRESAAVVAKEFRIPRVMETWQEVVQSPDIDAVCIGTWPNLHAEVTLAALQAGKHVLTEARMAATLAEAEAMLQASRRQPQLVAQIVPAPMSLPFDATIVDLLASGELGELREVAMWSANAASADPHTPMNWRQDVTCSGKNTMFLGIFYEMIFRWLRLEPQSLIADAAIFAKTRPDRRGMPQPVAIPESLTVLGTYPGGARLIGHFSGVETSFPRSELRLSGTKAGLRLDLTKGELTLTRSGRTEVLEIDPAKRGAWQVEEDFVRSIRTGTPVTLTDFSTGVAYMRFTEAVWNSWNAGGTRVFW